jgi:Dolichyl-phosphate-mannose-protein mannosyltransferase
LRPIQRASESPDYPPNPAGRVGLLGSHGTAVSEGIAGQSRRPTVRLPTAVSAWRYLDISLLSLIVISVTGFNLLWTRLDSHRLYWDFARHLGDSLFYKDTFTLSHPLRYLNGYVRYPPLMYWVTDVFYAVLGSTDLWVAILSNGVFIAILVFSTYGIGKTLWNRRVGLLAGLVVVTSPMFVTQFQEYMLDAPLSAMVAAALYFLIRSNNFASRRHSLLFGAACGGGLLIKWTFPFFLVLPVVVCIGAALATAGSTPRANRLVNVAGAGLTTAAISALWYLPNYTNFRADIHSSTGIPASAQGDPPVGSLSSALWYLWSLLNNELYLIPFLFFAVGVVYLFLKDKAASKNMLLILSVIGSYVALSAIELKDFRYTMPMISAIAVIAISWLEFLRPRLRQWLGGGLIAYSILTFFVISFGTSLLPKDITIPLKARSFTSDLADFAPPESSRVTGIVLFAQHGFRVGAPSSQQWHQEDVFREMASRRMNASFWFTEPAETIWFTSWGIRYFAFKYHMSWVPSTNEAQFLIIRGPVPAGVTNGFRQIKEYPLPYAGPLRLYEQA